jgi:miniconductance mechanosensitive channel
MNIMDSFLHDDLFLKMGLSPSIIFPLKGLILILLIVLLCIIANWIAKRIILAIVSKMIRTSRNQWDDVMLEKKVFHRLSHFAPVMVIYLVGPTLLNDYPRMTNYTNLASSIYVIFMVLIVFYAFLDTVGAIYGKYEISRSRPIKGYLQVTKIIAGMIAAIFALSILLDRSPVYFFTGLGAVTAVLLLVFKDTIMGFVAGVQVTTNNLVQIGDWIEMPKYGADGDVIDISLHTVTIRNFDRTLTTIPTYALVSDSFKNWRGMVQTGGRRIKRDLYVDINSIKFCDEQMLQKFESVHLLRDYVKEKRKEIEEYNQVNQLDTSVIANGRRMTNIGTFRAYILSYLRNHPKIHTELTCMVRQMPPGEKGVALQVYAFTNDIAWVNYEGIQADIFDHILSVVKFFELRVFQFPTEVNLSLSHDLGLGTLHPDTNVLAIDKS